MSNNVPVTLVSKTGKDLVEGDKGGTVSIGDGYCKFPFVYKGKKYTKCVKKGLDHI